MGILITILVISAVGGIVTGHTLLGIYLLIATMLAIVVAALRHIAQPGPIPRSGGTGGAVRIYGTAFDPNAPAKQIMPSDKSVVTVPARNRYDDPDTDATMLSGDSLFPK